MRTKITVKRTTNLTEQEYKSLIYLNCQSRGIMQSCLKESYYSDEYVDVDHVIMLRETKTKRVLAWCHIRRTNLKDKPLIAHYYTRRSCRRCGYGTKIANAVLKKFGNHKVYPRDDDNGASQYFFESI